MAIIDAPATLRTAAATIALRTTVATQRSPYSGAEHLTDFGGEWWEMTVVTPPMRWAEAAALAAWADRVMDAADVARLAPPRIAYARGTVVAETATVTATTAALSRTLPVSGLGAGLVLAAGSWLSVGDRLHRLRQDGVGDAAALWLSPRVRTSTPLGTVAQIGAGVRGLWRLVAAPTLDFEMGARGAVAAPMTFGFVEAVNP